ncbi:MAG: proline dehydrogenase family protein [Bdellovibrionales bacterium]|nr:proline dehydrogenase family protein [Bdellovibrionales bacterium]
MDSIENSISAFAAQIFEEIGQQQPSAFNKDYWSGRIMQWSMNNPEFKVNMFRLVDVLPTLKSSYQIATHVNQYLGKVGAEMNWLFGWGLNMPPRSLRAKLAGTVVTRAVKETAKQFIAGKTPKEALPVLRKLRSKNLAFTVDLLGEYSLSEPEATQYFERYSEAISVLGEKVPSWPESRQLVPNHPCEATPVNVSVKLSALYSQCTILNFERSVAILTERLSALARKAKQHNTMLYVDAEDTATNPIIYAAFCKTFGSPEFADFPLPGIVLQAYTKEAESTLISLFEFSKRRGAPIAVRLVKGAYWDQETIAAKQNDWPSPLFAHKESSDANYEHLTRLMLDNHDLVMPAFGSHNVRSLSHAVCYAEHLGLDPTKYELQMLFGMADPIAAAFVSNGCLVRLYVPLGEMIPGMGYLVRRLLENTSNESFLRHTFYDSQQLTNLIKKPQMRD